MCSMCCMNVPLVPIFFGCVSLFDNHKIFQEDAYLLVFSYYRPHIRQIE